MNEFVMLIMNGSLMGLVVFVLILNQLDRKKGIERELLLIKGVLANSAPELQLAQDSPKDLSNRMKLENDLATKAVKLEEAKKERGEGPEDSYPVQ